MEAIYLALRTVEMKTKRGAMKVKQIQNFGQLREVICQISII
jgi:hypothetical protein